MGELCKLQECQLDILAQIDRVCKENNLSYCLAYGTCLGAIRHKGFIPWDDDIDIQMPIEDFNKLKKIKKAFKDPYFLQTRDSDPGYGLAIGRVRNSNTTLIEKDEDTRDINHGVFVDIYPLYNVPQSGIRYKWCEFESLLYRLMMYGKCPRNCSKVVKAGSKMLLKIFRGKMREKIIKLTYGGVEQRKRTGYVSALYAGAYYSIPEAVIFPAKRVQFENLMVSVPADYDLYLKMCYGEYMKLPPVEERVIHHDYECVDTEHSYKKYRGIYYCRSESEIKMNT